MSNSNVRKVLSNTIYQTLGRVVSAGETLLATALITRALGPVGYGEITLIVTYTTMFFVMADFGINSIVVREWAGSKDKAQSELPSLFLLRFGISVVLSLIAGTIAFLAWGRLPGYNQTVVTGILISLVLIFGQGVYFTCSAVFQSFSSYAKAFWASLWGNAVALALVVMALKIAPNVLGLTLALVVGSLVPSLIAWYYVRDFINFGQLKVNTNFCKKLLIASFPTGVGLVINTIYTSSDRLLLSVLSTTAMLGFYGLAYKIF